MKLLFDEHISFRAVRSMLDVFPDAKHLRFFGLEESADAVIWNFAKKEGYAIITKDDDFRELSMTFGHPPKVVWLKTGNLKSSELAGFLWAKADVLAEFIESADESLLVLR